MSLFNPSRDQAREFFFALRAKSLAGEPLTPLETAALAIVIDHPEYHRHLDDPERWRERTWTPEDGETNPFLHLALHLALDEQVSIDQPAGIRETVRRLAGRLDSEHEARHVAMECLVEALWTSQNTGKPLDGERYLEDLRRRAGGP
jgi:hypothetical protein